MSRHWAVLYTSPWQFLFLLVIPLLVRNGTAVRRITAPCSSTPTSAKCPSPPLPSSSSSALANSSHHLLPNIARSRPTSFDCRKRPFPSNFCQKTAVFQSLIPNSPAQSQT
ncbi:MAG: hypothetical protein AAF614_02825 [Chloroflexota bacterium]